MQNYKGPASGSFLDLDMVCFGELMNVCWNKAKPWQCKFTEDQKRTFMVQRALAASPLMLGGRLHKMDAFSLSLFKHPEILACQKNAVIGKLAHRDGKLDVWKTPEFGKPQSGWIGIFNRDGKQKMSVTKTIKDLGLDAAGKYILMDIWTKKTLPVAEKHTFEVPVDGVVFLRYQQK